MRCHFLVSKVSKLGKAGLYCVTKGNILHTCITALLFNCRFSVPEFDFREVFLYNTQQVGYHNKLGILYSEGVSRSFSYFPRNLFSEPSPLIKPFVMPGG